MELSNLEKDIIIMCLLDVLRDIEQNEYLTEYDIRMVNNIKSLLAKFES